MGGEDAKDTGLTTITITATTATTKSEAASSGSEVPTATMVRPTSVSDIPNSMARSHWS